MVRSKYPEIIRHPKATFEGVLPLKGKVHYIENDCRDIWEWAEKVYEFAKSID